MPAGDYFLPMDELPRGTVTFLATDIQGSTEMWERYPDAMTRALDLCDYRTHEFGDFVWLQRFPRRTATAAVV